MFRFGFAYRERKTLCNYIKLQKQVGDRYERFGRDIALELCGENNYRITVPVQVSKTFFGWLASFGGAVRLHRPEEVKDRYEEFIKGLVQSMEKN